MLAFTSLVPAWTQDHWLEIKSPHFDVWIDGGEKRGRELALQFEQMRSVFAQLFLKEGVDSSLPFQIIALKNEKDLSRYAPLYNGKPVPVAGLCQTGPDGNYILLDLLASNSWEVVFHEYAHLLLNSNFSDLPVWFSEGFAGYYSSIQIDRKQALIGRPPHGFLNILSEEKLLPVTTLFSVTQSSPFYNELNQRSLFYAESWLVVHYLWDSSRRGQLNKYLELVRQRMPVDEAIRQSFNMTPSDLDKEIDRYYRAGPKALRFSLSDVFEKGQFSISVVAPLEAAAMLADVHLHQHDYEEQGVREFQEILKRDPENAAAHRGLGHAYFNRNNFDEAMPHLEKAAEKDPKDWQVHYYQAMLLSQKQDPSAMAKMEKEARTMIELNPGVATGYGLLGFALMTQHKNVEATAAYEKAVSLNPASESYRLNLAELYSLQNKLDQAKVLFLSLENSANITIATAARSHLELMRENKPHSH